MLKKGFATGDQWQLPGRWTVGRHSVAANSLPYYAVGLRLNCEPAGEFQMNQAMVIQSGDDLHRPPSIIGALIFRLKTLVFQSLRVLRNVQGRRRYASGKALTSADVLSESSSLLSTSCDEREGRLVAGKVHNLRIA